MLSPPVEYKLTWKEKSINVRTCVKNHSLGIRGKWNAVHTSSGTPYSLRCSGGNTNTFWFYPSWQVMKLLL